MTPGSCPGCGKTPGRLRLMCDVCWSDVPPSARARVEKAWKAYRANNSKRTLLAAYENAIAAAASHIVGGR